MIKDFFHFLFPARCLVCRDVIGVSKRFCGSCFRELPWIKETVFLPVSDALVLFWYQSPVDYFISRLKFQGKLIYGQVLGELFIERLKERKESLPQYLIPVPLHMKRLRERGFNQSVAIAKPISKYFKIPIAKYFCQRIKATRPQMQLTAKARAHNVKKAFGIHRKMKMKHVAIIDDVMTTGNTLTVLVELLQLHGVKRIEVWCVAKTHFT